MSIHKLRTKQFLPLSIEEAWDFFSNPSNLHKITPAKMNFRITSGNGDLTIYPGMFVTYKIKPIAGIDIQWVTEITHVEKQRYFIDEQRKGPYKIWHHEHFFTETEGGVLMEDILHYEVGFGWIGDLLTKLFIEKEVKSIFSYRSQILKTLFDKEPVLFI